uniref:DUF488 domain-containing protein n=1 Tax=Schlesneria paludicola TaxID=360056 RepID=A0A7C2JZD4_9PLAN
MFNRQKAVLHLVELAGGTIDRLVLTKWAFLVRRETESRGGGSFYDFVPYHYGPFSFGLYHEAAKLVAQGYLRETDSGWGRGPASAPLPEPDLQNELKRLTDRLRRLSVEALLDYVYERYPRFTINSQRRRLATRPTASLAVYTAGYEGLCIDGFLDLLTRTGITHVIDVRRNPVARRYGFHRSTLARLLERLGLQYSHVPALGIASEQRRRLETAQDYQALFQDYEGTTLQTETVAIGTVANWVTRSPSVLICRETDPHCCHRGRLADPVSRITGLPVVHLG